MDAPVRPRLEIAMLGTWLLALAAFLVLTNFSAFEHASLLLEAGRWGTLAAFLGVWGIAIIAIVAAALNPSRWVRAAWAAILALGGAFGYAFYDANGAPLSIFDAVSLWGARHEASRALEFYAAYVPGFVVVLAAGFLVMVMFPLALGPKTNRFIRRLAWVPLVPVLMFAGIMYLKNGGGFRGLPTQFAPYSIGALAAAKIASDSMPVRHEVAWTPAGPAAGPGEAVRRIVILVDESIRGDYIDWSAGNPFTPELARQQHRIVRFGPAASGGNCSQYSNAILRFMGARNGLERHLLTNPTIWQYAKKAGYRTVFIDAQAGFVRYPGKLQNFMTPEEVQDIDSVNAADEKTPAHALDDALLDVVLRELDQDTPVLIYANKNGAHFPYDRGYPATEAKFRPTMTESSAVGRVARLNSYRNAVRWSVDGFFKRLFEEARLDGTVVIYTSDHGQEFADGRLSQCTVEDPDPRQGLVPLFVASDDAALRNKLAGGAEQSRGHGSHFQIAPTVLRLMGYAQSDIASAYGPSLFEKNGERPAFSSGDVFGLFSQEIRWNPIDLTRSYLEPEAIALAGPQPNFAASTERRKRSAPALQ